MTTWFTDYPIEELGDQPYQVAPMREVELLSYDGDKYVKVLLVDDQIVLSIKSAYIYSRIDKITLAGLR